MDDNQEKEEMKEKQEEVAENTNKEQEEVEESTNKAQEEVVESTNKEVEVASIEQETQNNENVVKNQEKKKGSYIIGIIGAILGGFVASIPWILTYSFANMIIAILATLIAGGAFLGYKIFKGKIGKGLPAIITIVSLLVVTVVTTVICPIILIYISDYPITLNNFINLYTSEARVDVRNAIIQDLIVSIVFTIIGIAAVVRSISAQIRNGATSENLKFDAQAANEEAKKQLKEQSELVKKACTNLNCKSKESASDKQEILNELEMIYGLEHKKAKKYFATCVSYKLLKKYKGKYYYDETDEILKIENAVNAKHSSPIKVIMIILLVLIIAGAMAYVISNITTDYIVPNTNIKLDIDYDSQELFGTAEEITKTFGEYAAEYNDFIIMDKSTKYEIYGEVVSKEEYGDEYDFATVMQATRDYYAQVIGEDTISDVEDIQLGEDLLKRFDYDYDGTSGEEYTAIVYSYESGDIYLWIYVYIDRDVEITQMDTVIDNLLK